MPSVNHDRAAIRWHEVGIRGHKFPQFDDNSPLIGGDAVGQPRETYHAPRQADVSQCKAGYRANRRNFGDSVSQPKMRYGPGEFDVPLI